MPSTETERERLGRIAHEAYCDVINGPLPGGEPLHWTELGDVVKGAWIAAAMRVEKEVRAR